MPRPPRIDEAGGLYHALNRGNARATIFHKPEDYQAFERVLAAGLERYQIQLFCYVLMPNHWHLILRPTIDGEMSRFMRWITATHTMRYHAHYQTGGQGHVYQGRFKSFPIQDDEHFLTVCRYVERNPVRAEIVTSAEQWSWSSLRRWSQTREPDPKLLTPWPIPRLPRWLERVNTPLSAPELNAIRQSVQKGKPLGDPAWTSTTAQRLNLNSTLRPRGRPRLRALKEETNEACPFIGSN
jgi:putative transposase